MGLWANIKSWLGIGLGAAAGGASANPLSVAKAGAEMVTEVGKDIREGNRTATERAISKEKEANDAAIEAAIKKATQTGAALALLALLGLGSVGCASAPTRDSSPSTGNVARLLKHPQFQEAARLFPELEEDQMKTINSIEADLQRERARANHVP